VKNEISRESSPQRIAAERQQSGLAADRQEAAADTTVFSPASRLLQEEPEPAFDKTPVRVGRGASKKGVDVVPRLPIEKALADKDVESRFANWHFSEK